MFMKDEINNLINKIVSIPGDKIITLASHNDERFSIDISNDNEIGYAAEHKYLFQAKLAKALRYSGGMIIRQFLSLRVKRKMPNGKELWIPEKNIYGVVLGNGRWFGMDIPNLKLACETDASGKPIPQEVGVHYKVFPS